MTTPHMTEILKKNGIRYGIAALAFIGAGLMGYLIHVHNAGAEGAVCDISAALSCSQVNGSIYAELLGVPLSVMGLLYFLAIAGLMLVPGWPGRFRDTIAITTLSLIFGIYLSSIEFFVIDSFCLFCEASKVVMLFILVLAAQGAKASGERVSWRVVAAAIMAGVLFSGGAYLLQREPPSPSSVSSVRAMQ